MIENQVIGTRGPMANKQYHLPEDQKSFVRNKIRSFQMTRILGIPFFAVLNVLVTGGDWVLFGVLTGVSSAVCYFLPIPALKRYGRIIVELQRTSDEITFRAWAGETHSVAKTELRLTRSTFEVTRTKSIACYRLHSSGKEFFLLQKEGGDQESFKWLLESE